MAPIKSIHYKGTSWKTQFLITFEKSRHFSQNEKGQKHRNRDRVTWIEGQGQIDMGTLTWKVGQEQIYVARETGAQRHRHRNRGR